MSELVPILTIRLCEPTTECCICGEITALTHAVGYCCGPTHDEIGTKSTEYKGLIVGGMPVCKRCHDEFYDESAEDERPMTAPPGGQR